MKKNLLNWMTILMVTIVSVGFVSCGNDDDDEKGDSVSIVGTWRYSNDYYGEPEGYEQYIFKRDGSGYYEDWGYENGKAELYDRYAVIALTTSRLVLLEKGETEPETYVKQ
ncbi:MAG: hypothetical protein IJV36_07785 [Prevotella sp.]|nr:hypothetical protein [Prevotella sp.]